MAKQICKKCGFEGRGKRVGERRGGGVARMLGVVLMLPIYSLWKAVGGSGGKQCPHCGLPTMVKLNSDAGRLARHLFDVELGLVSVAKESPPAHRFGDMPGEAPRKKKTIDPDQW